MNTFLSKIAIVKNFKPCLTKTIFFKCYTSYLFLSGFFTRFLSSGHRFWDIAETSVNLVSHDNIFLINDGKVQAEKHLRVFVNNSTSLMPYLTVYFYVSSLGRTV